MHAVETRGYRGSNCSVRCSLQAYLTLFESAPDFKVFVGTLFSSLNGIRQLSGSHLRSFPPFSCFAMCALEGVAVLHVWTLLYCGDLGLKSLLFYGHMLNFTL